MFDSSVKELRAEPFDGGVRFRKDVKNELPDPETHILLCIHSTTGGNITLSFFHTCVAPSVDPSGIDVRVCFYISVYKMPQVV